MGLKEEITDVLTEKAIRELKVGTVLKFDYEGSPIHIKITRKDTKNMRIWGEHLTLGGMDEGMSHYGHNIDTTQSPVFCEDCEVPVTEFATKVGEEKAMKRDPALMKKLRGKGKL